MARKKKAASGSRKAKGNQPQYSVDQPRTTTHNRDEVRRVTTHRQGHTK